MTDSTYPVVCGKALYEECNGAARVLDDVDGLVVRRLTQVDAVHLEDAVAGLQRAVATSRRVVEHVLDEDARHRALRLPRHVEQVDAAT